MRVYVYGIKVGTEYSGGRGTYLPDRREITLTEVPLAGTKAVRYERRFDLTLPATEVDGRLSVGQAYELTLTLVETPSVVDGVEE